MKLKNKKTGEISTGIDVGANGEVFWVLGKKPCMYDTLTELNAEWEDYEPKEPLIKDEKVRKAVRAWADACRLKYAIYKQSSNEFYDLDTRGKFAIKFTLKPIEVWLDDGKCYTIDELCGEVTDEA